MSLEQQIAELNTNIKALIVTLASGTALNATGGDAPQNDKKEAKAEKVEKPTKAEKKEEAKKEEAKKEETKAAEVKWADVLNKIKEVNSSAKDGCGRAGVTAILEKFGKAGEKVPALESVGKHAEILAFAQSLLDGKAAEAGEDDLGI